MHSFRKYSRTMNEYFNGKHRFEHWYRDNTVYFITSKVRDGFHAFRTEAAKQVFWDRFDHYSHEQGYVPWVTTLMDNHYHTLGYLKVGENLQPFMRKLHGSVAMMVCKSIGITHKLFWKTNGGQDYFDGCIRDVLQASRAYRYTLLQAVRAGIVRDWWDYPHTRVKVEMERAIAQAVELRAFMEGVPYARYERRKRQRA